ncbi:serine/threonine-protein phosphatase [Acidiferrimicrobium sp. IK]|uniref:PP2C family protein-serine/threonine phosphatase n=1 Tax=Acidiferrimicrobium sp. IK TaxID=2871700 RepID=UPI0021CB9477|nr:PP2C family protein-serine/threonine phosphatase [Acidiferrimicrobium sp. IK]MCU4186401.1 serine/threonine-protein phosphatase [Acidiferrimicrobium sp. IK]
MDRSGQSGAVPSTGGAELGSAGSEARWLAVSVAVMAILAAIDLTLPSNANISGALVVAPFLASVGSRPKPVAALGALAVLAALGLADADGSGLHASAARVSVILVGTGVALEAARVRVRRERRLVDLTNVSQAAQAAIIRQPPPMVGEVAVGSWYEASVRAATVGGDCYEALDTNFGTRLLVGDVRGHGLPSVRLAALVVGGFRALAHVEPDLATVAHELDLLVSRYARDLGSAGVDGEEFVTAVMAEVRGSTVTLANCGHPPPLLVTPEGKVTVLAASSPSPPLGVGSDPDLESVAVPAGGRVLLYTDGLIEARDASGAFFDLEAAAVVLAEGPLDDGVRTIMAALEAHASGRVTDDVAILAFEPAARRAPAGERAR